jgi:hypothetical protein
VHVVDHDDAAGGGRDAEPGDRALEVPAASAERFVSADWPVDKQEVAGEVDGATEPRRI